MFERILCPLDLDEGGNQAIEAVAELASLSKGTVYLLHVIETIRDTPFEELKDFYGGLQEKANKRLAEVERTLSERGIDCRIEVAYGERVAQILESAKKVESDVIVLASHRIDPQSSRGWGTVSYKVGLLAPCPVLLVK